MLASERWKSTEYTTADQLPMGTAAELKTGKRSGYSAKKTKGSNTAEKN